MASIDEEMRQSRQAAEEITAPQMKPIIEKLDAINERRQRARSEMMARHSGGAAGVLDPITKSSPLKLLREYARKGNWDGPVYSGKMTPREYFEERPDEVNYTGIGRYRTREEAAEHLGDSFMVTDFASRFKNDFISALYNGETPLEELGVEPISEDTRDIYRRIFTGETYSHVVGDKFRGYQLAKEELPFAEELNQKVRKGDYTQKRQGTTLKGEENWALGDTGHYYDAGYKEKDVKVRHTSKVIIFL